MQLETERLVLRKPRPEDVEGLLGTYGDPEVMRYIAGGDPWTRERTRRALERWLRYWDDDGFGLFVIEDAEGRLLGDCGLLPWDSRTWSTGSRKALREHAEVEIGWTLARAHWGRGYATEAGRAIVALAFGDLDLPRLISLIQPGNERSIRVATKLGEHYDRDVVTAGGEQASLYVVER